MEYFAKLTRNKTVFFNRAISQSKGSRIHLTYTFSPLQDVWDSAHLIKIYWVIIQISYILKMQHHLKIN